MKATEFEYRHQTLVHVGVVAVAFATYLFDPDDVVWKLVRDSSAPRQLERTAFFVATVLIGVGAANLHEIRRSKKKSFGVRWDG